MRVCLINPIGQALAQPSIPHGLLQLAAELKRTGHEVQLLDLNLPGVTADPAFLSRFDLVGLSAMTGQLRQAVALAEELDGKVPVVWGGVHCFLDPLSILGRFPGHFVVSGDGEAPLLALLDHLGGEISREELKTRPGINLCDLEPVLTPPAFSRDLEALADIDYFDLPGLELYLNEYNYYAGGRFPSLQILTGRGCHWRCSFCLNSLYADRGAVYRRKSMAKVRRETEKVIDQFQTLFVHPRDEDFFSHWPFVEEWMAYAREKGFLWEANGRFNYFNGRLLTGERLRALTESGLYVMGMSIEAGSEKLRNEVLNKRVKDKEILEAVRMIRTGVPDKLCVNCSFIVYFPGDTPENRRLTLGWMDALSRRMNILFSGPQVYRSYPGSALYCLEPERKEGDLDFYLTRLSLSGAESRLARGPEAAFHSQVLPLLFNNRYGRLEIRRDDHGRPEFRHRPPRRLDPERLLLSTLTFLLMAGQRIRTRLGWWSFFVEPRLLVLLLEGAARLGRLLRPARGGPPGSSS